MAHAYKGGISHSPRQQFAAPKQRYAPPRRRFALGRTKAITPNRPERAAIPRQKMPLGGLAAAFSSLAGGKRDYGASRSISKSQKKLEKERRSAKSDRKAPDGAPNAMLGPCSEAPYRRFLPSCEQNRATAASHKEKSVKRYEHLAGFRSDALNPLRTQHVYWARKDSQTQSAVVCESILERPLKTPLRHGITAFSLNRKALAGPPLSPGQWAHGETGWWPFRGIGHARFLASKQ